MGTMTIMFRERIRMKMATKMIMIMIMFILDIENIYLTAFNISGNGLLDKRNKERI
jgi:hypothetical protein